MLSMYVCVTDLQLLLNKTLPLSNPVHNGPSSPKAFMSGWPMLTYRTAYQLCFNYSQSGTCTSNRPETCPGELNMQPSLMNSAWRYAASLI